MNKYEQLSNYLDNEHLICEITENGTAQVRCLDDNVVLYKVAKPSRDNDTSEKYNQIAPYAGAHIWCNAVAPRGIIIKIVLSGAENGPGNFLTVFNPDFIGAQQYEDELWKNKEQD